VTERNSVRATVTILHQCCQQQQHYVKIVNESAAAKHTNYSCSNCISSCENRARNVAGLLSNRGCTPTQPGLQSTVVPLCTIALRDGKHVDGFDVYLYM